MEKTVVVRNLSKTFRLSKRQMRIDKTTDCLKKAVVDLNFETYSGEIFGLLGPNGAGKTTTLRMLSTLIKPDSGEIEILSENIRNETFVKKNIGFLTSELKLEDSFTPSYLFNYFAGFHDLTKEEIEKRKKELFGRFGIEKFQEIKIAELSTGMKQKVSLVIALIHDPKIIIFDEPTNGLDVLTAKTVTDFLLDLKNEGKTIIISTHIMSLVDKLCDRVGIIIDGNMVACGPVKEIKEMAPSKDLEDVFFELYKNVHGGDM